MCSLDYDVIKQCGVLSQSLKHDSTRKLFDYWNRRRGRRRAAARSDIDPTDIRDALPDAFMLSADFTDEIRFRLAGTQVCALFGRELKGESFKSIWSNTSRNQVDAILTSVIDEDEVLVAGVLGRTEDGAEVELELLLLPLARHERSRIRALGILAPLTRPHWLCERPSNLSSPPLISTRRKKDPAHGTVFSSIEEDVNCGRMSEAANASLTID